MIGHTNNGDKMNKIKGIISISDYKYTKKILEQSLVLYKKLNLYIKLCPNQMIRSNIIALKNSIMEQFSQLIVILEVQDENKKDN